MQQDRNRIRSSFNELCANNYAASVGICLSILYCHGIFYVQVAPPNSNNFSIPSNLMVSRAMAFLRPQCLSKICPPFLTATQGDVHNQTFVWNTRPHKVSIFVVRLQMLLSKNLQHFQICEPGEPDSLQQTRYVPSDSNFARFERQ